MVNYQNGKIYKIVCNKTGKCYIGSTAKLTLAQRLVGHKEGFKKWSADQKHYTSSYEILKEGDYYILLIEDFSCDSKDQLRAREQYHIDHNDCINMRKSLRTEEQKKEYNQQWMNQNIESHKDRYNETRREKYNNDEEHKAKVNQSNKECYQKHKEEHNKKTKEYYEANKETINEYQKEYRENNSQNNKEYQKEYREKNKEKSISYYEANKEKINAQRRARNALKKQNDQIIQL